MILKSAVDWLTWGALVLPLTALAWSAVQYVLLRRREERNSRFEKFFRVMDLIGAQQGSVAAKMASVNELRKYPEYAALIQRLCNSAAPRVIGENADMLRREFELTSMYFDGLANIDD